MNGQRATSTVVDPEAHSARLHEDVPESELAVLPDIGHVVHYAASDVIVASPVESATSRVSGIPETAQVLES